MMPTRLPAPLGTEWVTPGAGAKALALSRAVYESTRRGDLSNAAINRCAAIWIETDNRTNLRLTGRRLTATDLERIAQCEAAK